MPAQFHSMEIRINKMIAATLVVGGLLSGCAGSGAGGFDAVNFSNAAQVHIFTPDEQNGMTTEGTIPTMLAPSEVRVANLQTSTELSSFTESRFRLPPLKDPSRLCHDGQNCSVC